jgi:alkylhydroperoxidase/carboxymuconolactone decarboxylase family protein YurZ
MDSVYGELHERGKVTREAVLGSEWVEKTQKRTETFASDGQNTVTSLVWGGVWSRPGLSLRDRSLITIAIVAAQGHLGPLELHIAAGLRNGLTAAELEEAFLQIGAYAGFTATTMGNAAASRVLSTLPEHGGGQQ